MNSPLPTSVKDRPPGRKPAAARGSRSWLPPRAALVFWQHARKIVVLVVGLTVVLTGVALLVLPGPGWLIIFGGLGLLGTEFAWARWILKQAADRFNQLKEAALQTWNQSTTAASQSPREHDSGKPGGDQRDSVKSVE